MALEGSTGKMMGIVDKYQRFISDIPEYVGEFICMVVYMLFQVALVGGVISYAEGSSAGLVGFGALGLIILGFVYSA